MKTALGLIAMAALSAPDRSTYLPTEANLRLIQSAVHHFRMDSGRLPTEEEGLAVLVRRPHDWPEGVAWTPFVETTELLTDCWGHEYVYVADAELRGGFGIYSCGLDGVTSSVGDDRDDINTWNTQRPWADYYASQTRRSHTVWYVAALVCAFLVLAVASHPLWTAAEEWRSIR